MKHIIYRWGLLWWSKNKPDIQNHLIFKKSEPVTFRTRKEAREFANQEYGYIKTRKEARAQPFGWRFPKAVRISITIDTLPCMPPDHTPQAIGNYEDR